MPIVITLKSKTHILGIAMALFAAILQFLPGLEPFMTPEVYSYILAVLSIVTVALRNITSKPIDQK